VSLAKPALPAHVRAYIMNRHSLQPADQLEPTYEPQIDLPVNHRAQRTYTDDRGHQAIRIGQGQESLVVKYISGPDTGLVCRISMGFEHEYVRCNAIHSLRRFRLHQLAHCVEPSHFIQAIKVDLDRQCIFSLEVPRSKENLRDATPRGVLKRADRTFLEIDADAKSLAARIKAKGIDIHLDYPNVSVVKDGTTEPKIIFFEIDGIFENLLRGTISNELSGEKQASALGILDRYLFETQLDLMDIYDLSDPALRTSLLTEMGRPDLLSGYEQEIGISILIKPYRPLRIN
jgi:hypothetical protein